jgi:Glycosyl transferase family 2
MGYGENICAAGAEIVPQRLSRAVREAVGDDRERRRSRTFRERRRSSCVSVASHGGTIAPWAEGVSRVSRELSSPRLSIVMPVHNEAAHLPSTVDALLLAVERSGLTAELVVVDDGSTDGSGDVASAAVANRMPARVLRQPNRGRLAARRRGVGEAQAELVLLLDGRVRVEPDALSFVADRLARGEEVWTGHVHVAGESAFGEFWSLLAELAWREYFDDPRTTSFGVDDFDKYPKGTTCFLAPRALLLEAFAQFRSRYADLRNANDDTPVLRHVAARRNIHVSPSFACTYTPRETLDAFVKHAVHRGVVFVDGHGRPESRFFPVAVAFFPVSAAFAFLSLKKPVLIPATAALCSVAAATVGLRARRTPHEIRTLALVTPVYAFGHGVGMWMGLRMLVAARGRRG